MSWWLALGECKDTVVRCMLEYMDERGVVLALLLGGLLLLLFGFLYSRNNRKDQVFSTPTALLQENLTLNLRTDS